jgi:hypothetical protein
MRQHFFSIQCLSGRWPVGIVESGNWLQLVFARSGISGTAQIGAVTPAVLVMAAVK